MSKKTNINFDDGMMEIMLNDDPGKTIKWNPGDVNFLDKFSLLMDWVRDDGGMQELIASTSISKCDDSMDNYNVGDITMVGDMLNEKIDNVFGEGTSNVAFSGTNPISSTESGMPLFFNFMMAMEPLIEKSRVKREKAGSKYLSLANDHKRRNKE